MTGSDIIDSLGGNAEVARVLGEDARTVWRWRSRGIPARYWHRVVEIARDREVPGVTYDTVARPLWQRHAPTPAEAGA